MDLGTHSHAQQGEMQVEKSTVEPPLPPTPYPMSPGNGVYIYMRLLGAISVPLLPQVFGHHINIEGNMALRAHSGDWRMK